MRSAVLIAMLALAACNQRPQVSISAARTASSVTIPEGSPAWNTLRVQSVTMAQVPAQELICSGKLEAMPARSALVSLPVPGRISAIEVRQGDPVRKGDVLLRLESPDADAAVSSVADAATALTQAQSAVVAARATAERLEVLFSKGSVAERQLTAARAAVAQAEASAEQAETALRRARRKIEILGLSKAKFGETIPVIAPIAGRLLELRTSPGEYRHDPATPIALIADLSLLWFSADVPERSIRLIRPGEPVQVELVAYPGDAFPAVIRQIADSVDPQTRMVRVRAELDNQSGRLRPEMMGQFRLIQSMQSSQSIPAIAVVDAAGQPSVWKQTGPRTFERVPVRVGKRYGDRVAITGLQPGDRIVAEGAALLRTD